MKNPNVSSPKMNLPARLILALDQGAKSFRFSYERSRFALRYPDEDVATRESRAYGAVLLDSWSPPSSRNFEPSLEGGQSLGKVEEERLLAAGPWRSVSEIPDFPFGSFAEVRSAIAAGQYYISVPSTAFLFAGLASSRGAQAFSAFISWFPCLIALASVPLAAGGKNAWMLAGIPAALAAFVTASSSVNLIRTFLFAARHDLAAPLPLRLLSALILMLCRPGIPLILGILLFNWMLLTDHSAAAWFVASYMFSFYAVRTFIARGQIAVASEAKSSEPFFLLALGHGACALRDKRTGEFLRMPSYESYTEAGRA